MAWLRGGGGGPGTLVEESFITNDYIEEAVDEEEDVIVASDETELLEHSCPFPPLPSAQCRGLKGVRSRQNTCLGNPNMNVDVASSRESFPTNSANIEARKLKVNRVKENVNNCSETKNKLVKTPVNQKKVSGEKKKCISCDKIYSRRKGLHVHLNSDHQPTFCERIFSCCKYD